MAQSDPSARPRPVCHIVRVKRLFLCTVCWRRFDLKDGIVEDECHEGGHFTLTIKPKDASPS
jgi:hypothetical protein